MDVDANIIINKLGDQVKQLATAIAIKDAQIELLQEEVAGLKTALTLQKEIAELNTEK